MLLLIKTFKVSLELFSSAILKFFSSFSEVSEESNVSITLLQTDSIISSDSFKKPVCEFIWESEPRLITSYPFDFISVLKTGYS